MIMAWHRSNPTSKRLNCIPGVGPLLATALVSSVPDPKGFRSGRNFSAWIGLVPKQRSSGGKDRLGSISKQGDRYLRSLFVAGALARPVPNTAAQVNEALGSFVTSLRSQEIAAVFGHRTLSEIERYTARADRLRLADSAISKLSDAE